MATKKPTATWSDVKAKLTDVDRAGLLGVADDMNDLLAQHCLDD